MSQDQYEDLPDFEEEGFEEPGQGSYVVAESSIEDEPEEEGVHKLPHSSNDAEPEEEEKKPEDVFMDDELSKEFLSAVSIGEKVWTVSVLGHDVKLKTLNIEDELNLGRLTEPYQNTKAFEKAYRCAVAALSVLSIDEEDFFVSIKDIGAHQEAVERFRRMSKYYSIFVNNVYRKVLEQEVQVKEFVEERLGK